LKLALKLPLALGACLLLTLAAALYGLYGLTEALRTYSSTLQTAEQNRAATDRVTILFKTQVQEWKNVLLRGKDASARDRHWKAFTQTEERIGREVGTLLAALPEGESKALLTRFSGAHRAMGERYRTGLDAFKAAAFEPVAGDTAVQGIDREPARLLEAASDRVAADTRALAQKTTASGRQATIVSIGLMLLSAALGIVGAAVFSRTVTRPIGQALDLARDVARGDLTRSVSVTGKDETAALLGAMAQMQRSLRDLVGTVRQNADSVATASSEIAQGNQDLSQRTERQASALQETSASMEELGTTVARNSESARIANDLALSASTIAQQGGEVVGQVIGTMKGIDDSSRKISDIIGVIDGIAFQTNLLALNAAVEAARAGEQGRGFAVVAAEVRSLAGRSADAARQIKSLIAASVGQVAQGSTLVAQAGSTMSQVVESIRRVTDVMGEISSAGRQQSAAVLQVGQAVSEMDQTTQQNAALVEESAAAAEALTHQAQQLAQAVAVFKIH